MVIAVTDLEQARETYEKILARRPSWYGEHPALGTANVLFRLANTYLELLAPAAPGPIAEALRARIDERGEGLFALAFGTEDADRCAKILRERGVEAADPVEGEGRELRSGAIRRWRNVMLPARDTRGVNLFAIQHLREPDALPAAEPLEGAASAVTGLDHVVVLSKDPEATRALYGDRLGIRLALDRSFEQRGTRLLFFRVGGVTIEIGATLGAEPEPDAPDRLWGLAYRVPSVLASQKRLARSGLDVSEVRVGRKPGTCVVTVREPTHGVATLIIGPE